MPTLLTSILPESSKLLGLFHNASTGPHTFSWIGDWVQSWLVLLFNPRLSNFFLPRSEVLTAVNKPILVFWVVTSCSFIGGYKHFWSFWETYPPRPQNLSSLFSSPYFIFFQHPQSVHLGDALRQLMHCRHSTGGGARTCWRGWITERGVQIDLNQTDDCCWQGRPAKEFPGNMCPQAGGCDTTTEAVSHTKLKFTTLGSSYRVYWTVGSYSTEEIRHSTELYGLGLCSQKPNMGSYPEPAGYGFIPCFSTVSKFVNSTRSAIQNCVCISCFPH